MKEIRVGSRFIGAGHPVLIVGELSGNHRGNYELAKESVIKMKECGIDAVKIQTLKPENITLDIKEEDFIIRGGTLWDGASLYDLYKEIYTPWEWTIPLMKLASDLGMEFFSSPFGHEEVEFLHECGVSAYKIASFEITDIPLIEHAASKGKPIIISTGIADKDDIQLAINACRRMNNDQIVILKCTSSYPTPLEEMNLSLIPTIKTDFDVEVGLSDHTIDNLSSIIAVSMGAVLIEKHFILDREIGGPDSEFSIEPNQWIELVECIRKSEIAKGRPDYILTDRMIKSRVYSRSLYVAHDVKKGELASSQNIISIRPGYGLHPKFYKEILGKTFKSNKKKGTRLSFDLFED